jgi:hypothetical protein
MGRHKWWISIAVLCLGAGCTAKTASQSSPEAVVADGSISVPSSVPSQVAPQASAPLASQDFFPTAPIAGSDKMQPLPMPNLIPPTASVERVPQINTGRPDPFASLNLSPTIVQSKQPKPQPVVAVAPAVVQPAQPLPANLPTVNVSALPQPATPLFPLPPLLSMPTQNLPPIGVPSQPPAPPISLAEAIEISGVVEVGGKKSVIVKVPTEHTSRYVTVGERLGNGTVLVKRVEMGSEPIVILEQEGREIIRSIGSGTLVGST